MAGSKPSNLTGNLVTLANKSDIKANETLHSNTLGKMQPQYKWLAIKSNQQWSIGCLPSRKTALSTTGLYIPWKTQVWSKTTQPLYLQIYCPPCEIFKPCGPFLQTTVWLWSHYAITAHWRHTDSLLMIDSLIRHFCKKCGLKHNIRYMKMRLVTRSLSEEWDLWTASFLAYWIEEMYIMKASLSKFLYYCFVYCTAF